MICPYCRTENRPGAVKCAACASWMVSYPPIREWYRAREGRLIAGVCRGLSNRFGVPVAALRLGFLLSLFLGGGGLIVYVAFWIAMPLQPAAELATAAPPGPPPVAPEPAAGGTST
jgi:phage shock protein PspC (stress-responsive transcriptional regulator)